MKSSERVEAVAIDLMMIGNVVSAVAQQHRDENAQEAAFRLRCAFIRLDGIREDVERLEAAVRPISRREAEAAGAVAPVRFFGRLVRVLPAALALMALPARAHAPETPADGPRLPRHHHARSVACISGVADMMVEMIRLVFLANGILNFLCAAFQFAGACGLSGMPQYSHAECAFLDAIAGLWFLRASGRWGSET